MSWPGHRADGTYDFRVMRSGVHRQLLPSRCYECGRWIMPWTLRRKVVWRCGLTQGCEASICDPCVMERSL